MKLTIIGSRSVDLNDHYVRFTHYVCEKLIPSRILVNIDINIEFNDRIHRDHQYGRAWIEETNSRGMPRKFGILVSRSTQLHKQLCITGHELTHVKQWATGQMKPKEAGRVANFMGTEYVMKNTDYWDRPWEIEAHGREKGLVEQYIAAHNLDEAEWVDGTIF